MQNKIEEGINNWREHMLYPTEELKEGEIHINPKTVLTEIIPFRMEDLE